MEATVVRRSAFILLVTTLLGAALSAHVPIRFRTPLTYVLPVTSSWPLPNAPRFIDPYWDPADVLTKISSIAVVDGYEDECVLVDGINTSCTIKFTFACNTKGASPATDCADRGAVPPFNSEDNDPSLQNIKLQLYVRGNAVSGQISYPFSFDLLQSDSDLATLCNGMSDISIDVISDGDDRDLYNFNPMLLHFWKSGHADCTDVPLQTRSEIYQRYRGEWDGYEGFDLGPHVVYVPPPDPATVRNGHPASTGLLLPWHDSAPQDTDLYQEEMAPHTNWSKGDVLPWQWSSYYPDAGKTYYRSISSKNDEDHQSLYTTFRHDVYYTTDGPRGVCTMPPYTTGEIDDENDFYVAQIDGAIREMHEDGSCETIVGYKVSAGKFPAFAENWLSNAQVREQMQFVGCVLSGSWSSATNEGIHTGLDVTEGPVDGTFYAVGYYDNIVWKIVEGACNDVGHVGEATLEAFVGQTDHSSGHANGTGAGVGGGTASFNHPSSVDYDPVCDCLYVADQDNDLIRKVTMAGVVTTLEGSYTSATGGAVDRYNDDSASLTGNVDTTAGSPNVLGHSTTFLADFGVGSFFEVTGVQNAVVLSITDDTHLTLDRNFSTNQTAHAYIRKATTTANANFITPSGASGGWQRSARATADLTASTLRFTVDSTQALAGKRPDICKPMTVRVGSDGDVYVLDQCFGSVRRINPATHVTTYVAGPFERWDNDGQGRGWTWFDVDRWGNSGYLDQIWYVVSQGSFFAQTPTEPTHTNEEYGWAKADGTNVGSIVFNDQASNPDGFGKVANTDPPHYAWNIAVSPNGGVYMAGFGEHGITRLRLRDADDTYPAQFGSSGYYDNGKKRWKNGGGGNTPGNITMSLQLVNGTNAHNYISDFGFADAWDYGCNHAVSSATLISDFNIDDTNIEAGNGGGAPGATALAEVTDFIRASFGRCVSAPTGDTPGAAKIVPRLHIRGDNTGGSKGGRK